MADARSRAHRPGRGTRTIRSGTTATSRCARRRSFCPELDGKHRPFGEWLRLARPTREEWREHLSTLFPEVRPRGHLELRSCDAVPPQWYAAPLALAVGITYDPWAVRAAADLLGRPDMELLRRAGRVVSPTPASGAPPLISPTSPSRDACTSVPGTSIRRTSSRPARLFDQYTRRGRSPADDLEGREIAA